MRQRRKMTQTKNMLLCAFIFLDGKRAQSDVLCAFAQLKPFFPLTERGGEHGRAPLCERSAQQSSQTLSICVRLLACELLYWKSSCLEDRDSEYQFLRSFSSELKAREKNQISENGRCRKNYGDYNEPRG